MNCASARVSFRAKAGSKLADIAYMDIRDKVRQRLTFFGFGADALNRDAEIVRAVFPVSVRHIRYDHFGGIASRAVILRVRIDDCIRRYARFGNDARLRGFACLGRIRRKRRFQRKDRNIYLRLCA